MNVMSVIGVDASSTRLAAVVLDGSMLHTSTLKLPGDIDKACQKALEWIKEVTTDHSPRLVALEAPFIHRLHPTGSIGLAQVNGALLAGLDKQVTISVQPSHWKKSILGVGNANKDLINEWVTANHPKMMEVFAAQKYTQDLTDAFCVALHGMHVLELRDKMLLTR